MVRDLYLARLGSCLCYGMHPGSGIARSFLGALSATNAICMTIELIDVTKKVRLGPIRLTYKDLNIRVEQNARMAFLAQKSAGVEAILNLICAADAPDSGIVRRTHSISWAIP